jgi:hypothetical protein
MKPKPGRLVNSLKKGLFMLMLALVCLVAIALLSLVAIECSPASFWRATPQGDDRDIDAAVVLAFGYVQPPQSPLEAGDANAFIFQWVRRQYPQVKTLLVQEGVWAAARSPDCRTCENDDVKLLRIHAHDEHQDVNTFDAAVCAVPKLRSLPAPRGRRKVLLVAHHLQLWRTQKCFEKVIARLCPECELVIPDIPDVPFPRDSAQWRTRSEFIFRLAELGGRLRDLGPFAPKVRDACVAPVADDPEAGSAVVKRGCQPLR